MTIGDEATMRQPVVGIDIGGTKIAAAVVYPDRSVQHGVTASTPAQAGAEAILDVAASVAAAAARRGQISPRFYGVGSAGAFDDHGVVVHSTDHLAGWLGTDVAGGLRSRLGEPIAVMNDVHAAAFGESWLPMAPPRFLFVAVGTGIGGAIVSEGGVLRGATGMAGSVGHITVAAEEHRLCSCGGTDHIEAFASGPGMELSYSEISGSTRGLREIGVCAAAGDAVAHQVIRAAAERLGEALRSAVLTIDPGTLLIGGGVAGLGAMFIEPLAHRLRERLEGPFNAVTVQLARAGSDAAILGAGRLAYEHGNSASL